MLHSCPRKQRRAYTPTSHPMTVGCVVGDVRLLDLLQFNIKTRREKFLTGCRVAQNNPNPVISGGSIRF